MSPMPPDIAEASDFLSGFSATMASVMINRPATEAASWSATRTTLAGSITPNWNMSVARQSKPCPLRQSSLTDAGELHPSEAASGNYDVWQTNCCKAQPFGLPPLAASGLTSACPPDTAPPSDVWQIVAG